MSQQQEQEVITLDSDDDDEGEEVSPPSLLPYNPGNYADLLPSSSNRLFPGPSARLPPPSSASAAAHLFPKRPGVFPPFALFTREHRDRVLASKSDISFAESSRVMGEMWHKLTAEAKETYRLRAKQITEQKLKQWQRQLRSLAPAQQAAIRCLQASKEQRRRTSAYNLFSSDARKKLGDTVAVADTSRIIGEQWRGLDQVERQIYEDRAIAINRDEERRQQGASIRSSIRNTGVVPGLRISSVSSLQQQQQQQRRQQQQQQQMTSNHHHQRPSPRINLPSSTTISRVAPEVHEIQQRLPSGIMLTTTPGPAARKRQQQQQQQQPPLLPSARQQQQQPKRPRPAPVRQQQHAPPPAQQRRPRVCRICGQNCASTSALSERKDVVQLLETVADLRIDLRKDREDGYPAHACRKCVTLVVTCSKFKKAVADGQKRLRWIVEARRARAAKKAPEIVPPPNPEVATIPPPPDPEVTTILPDDDHVVLLLPVNIKDEKIADIAANSVEDAAMAEAVKEEEEKNDSAAAKSDPLLFVQVGGGGGDCNEEEESNGGEDTNGLEAVAEDELAFILEEEVNGDDEAPEDAATEGVAVVEEESTANEDAKTIV